MPPSLGQDSSPLTMGGMAPIGPAIMAPSVAAINMGGKKGHYPPAAGGHFKPPLPLGLVLYESGDAVG